MSTNATQECADRHTVRIPANVIVGSGTVFRGGRSFDRFRSRRDQALRIGHDCLMDNVHFALGEEAEVEIGDECYFTSPLLLCELKLTIGSRVILGWNTTVMDTDFHPIDPALRIADAVACSPLGAGRPRPSLEPNAVTIEDEVWIGPSVTILKGVRIGAGSFIEPGAMIGKDVPPQSRVAGNPARIMGQIAHG
jgi:acetyltransferase-like isoleucine patch superfamily enzyme